jgi:hypothetical protein
MVRNTLFVLVVFCAFALAAAVAAAQPRTTTYHGVFSGSVDYVNCTTAAPSTIADGTWNIAVHGREDATVAINIFTDGKHHVSFGGVAPQVVPTGGQVFAVRVGTGAGPLLMSLEGDQFTYTIAPYHFPGGLVCDSVTYHGALR